MKTFKIELIPQDFRGTSYMSNSDCPLVRAVRRELGLPKNWVSAGGYFLSLWNNSRLKGGEIIDRYNIDNYGFTVYNEIISKPYSDRRFIVKLTQKQD